MRMGAAALGLLCVVFPARCAETQDYDHTQYAWAEKNDLRMRYSER
jgi:hypothetical protein